MATGTGGGDVQRMAQKVWGMLDKMAASNPEEYQKFVGQALDEGREFLDPPQPGFCFATGIRGRKNCRLYVNVCQWTRVPRPKTDSDPVPVKGGALRHLVDNGRRRLNELVIDIAVNSYVLQECLKERELKVMLVSLSLDFIDEFLAITTDRNVQNVEEEFKGQREDISYSLDEQWSELLSQESRLDIGDSLLRTLNKKQSQSKGSDKLPPLFPKQHNGQQSQCKAATLIEEVPGSSASSRSETQIHRRSSQNGLNDEAGGRSRGETEGDKGEEYQQHCEKTPQHSVTVERQEQREMVCVSVLLPGVRSVTDVELDISEKDLLLCVPGVYRLCLALPLPVDEETATARFSKRSHTLSVSLHAYCHS